MTDMADAVWQPPEQYNAAVYFVDGNVAAGRGAKVAFIDRSGAHTYGDLAVKVNRFGNALAALGVRREERVACCLIDTIDFPTAFFAGMKIGAVPVMINTLLTEANYRFILNDCRAQVLVVSAELLPTFAPILADLKSIKHVIVSGDGAGAHKSMAEIMAAASDKLDAAPTGRDDVGFWLYSSGSTGQPKGVKHLHASPMYTAKLYGQPVLGVREDDVVFSAAKLFFAYGLGNGISFPMSVGATTVLFAGRPTPDAMMATLKEHQPTIFYGVPTLYAAILANPENKRETTSKKLRVAASAGEPLPADIGRRWQERFGCPVLDGVGSTEMLHIYVSNRADDLSYGTSGKPVPGYAIRLVDEHGNDLPDGDIGEMLVRGPSMAEGYWNRREKTLTTFVGPWMWTGDKYVKVEGDYYQYAGRSDDMFKSGGNWVSPFDVESALISHAAVLEAGVIPRADESGNLKPMAYVVLAEGVKASDALADELKAHVKSRIEVWKYPRWIEFTESLPKTATGKIQRFKLREQQGQG
jgi:benzoate-CoA ligase family protein